MKLIKASKYILNIILILWVIGNFYFGWNKEPLSVNEEYFDDFINAGLLLYLVVYLIPLLRIYEKKVKEYDDNNNVINK